MPRIPSSPFILEGEIISVQQKTPGDTNQVRYTCHVLFDDGSLRIIPDVKEASLFGGIGDYYRRRARARTDGDFPQNSLQGEHLAASVGERVLICFAGGNRQNPYIIAYRQHPYQPADDFNFDSGPDSPRLVHQILGVRQSIDDKGQFFLSRNGLPTTQFSPGLPDAALIPADPSEMSGIDFLEGGDLKLHNYSGNAITLTGGNIIFDTPGDHTSNIQGKKEEIIQGDWFIAPNGNADIVVAGELHITPSGPMFIEGDDAVNIKSSSVVKIVTDGGATLNLDGGSVGLGANGIELLDLVSQILQKLRDLAKALNDTANQPIGNLGFPTTPNPAYTAFQAQFDAMMASVDSDLSTIIGSI